MITVTILADITRPGWTSVWYRRSTRIDYDTKAPRAKKSHGLIYQQGPRFGSVGDLCDYLRHDELLDLERRGFIRIHGRVSR